MAFFPQKETEKQPLPNKNHLCTLFVAQQFPTAEGRVLINKKTGETWSVLYEEVCVGGGCGQTLAAATPIFYEQVRKLAKRFARDPEKFESFSEENWREFVV
ncbi:MAG: hypothetical protein IJX71_06840 [Oscillospiraceae bacterium]|nr:hypothetical protein [Oscillospiraceae bacterium]